MENNVVNNIYDNGTIIVDMEDIQHIERLTHMGKPNGIWIIIKHTSWHFE